MAAPEFRAGVYECNNMVGFSAEEGGALKDLLKKATGSITDSFAASQCSVCNHTQDCPVKNSITQLKEAINAGQKVVATPAGHTHEGR